MPIIDESRLDDVEHLRRIDSRDALRSLATAGAQLRRSLLAAQEAGIERVGGGERPRAVLVASLGGSAVVGDILARLADGVAPVPVTVRHGGPLPGWVGPLDLVVAVSQSGRASGPVALAAEAGRRGAFLLTVGADDSPLAEVAARARGVHVPVVHEAPTSRAALWSLLTPVLAAAAQLALVDCRAHQLEATADLLDEVAEECRPSSESFVNPAKILAVGLAETVPVLLADGPVAAAAASRASAMLARTARVPATTGVLPEAASQVVALLDGPFTSGGGEGSGGFSGSDDIFADPFLDGPPATQLGLLMLRDGRTEGLTEVVLEEARAAGARVLEVGSRGESAVERLASLVAQTDFASTYLALGLGLDPSVSRHVADLRERTG